MLGTLVKRDLYPIFVNYLESYQIEFGNNQKYYDSSIRNGKTAGH